MKYNIRKKIISFCLAGVICCIFLSGCVPSEKDQINIVVSARSAVIVEARSGRVLYSKNPQKRYPPASTAKLMTAIVAVENMKLTAVIIPDSSITRVEPTVAPLIPGVSYKLKDLLAAILIKSANDAAVAIAEGVAGSERNFAVLMNEKARQIGMENTKFIKASGLPTGKRDKQYTTSEDLAKMIREASKYTFLMELMSQTEKTIQGSDKKIIYLKTHNKSLYSEKGASWGKTGYTKEARRTFAGTDPSYRPKIAFGLLKSNNLWKDIEKLKIDGLEIYREKHKNIVLKIIDWVKAGLPKH